MTSPVDVDGPQGRRCGLASQPGRVGLGVGQPDPVHRDDAALLPTGELGNLHDLYNVTADGIQLQFLPEELMFAADPVPHL